MGWRGGETSLNIQIIVSPAKSILISPTYWRSDQSHHWWCLCEVEVLIQIGKPSQSSQFEHSALFCSRESANEEPSSSNVDHFFASELQKIVPLRHTTSINPKYPPRLLSSFSYATLLNEVSRSKIWRCVPIAAKLWSGHLRSCDRPDVVEK